MQDVKESFTQRFTVISFTILHLFRNYMYMYRLVEMEIRVV